MIKVRLKFGIKCNLILARIIKNLAKNCNFFPVSQFFTHFINYYDKKINIFLYKYGKIFGKLGRTANYERRLKNVRFHHNSTEIY